MRHRHWQRLAGRGERRSSPAWRTRLSRQDAKRAKKDCCHFDQREKSFLDPSSLGMTASARHLGDLCSFARVPVFSIPLIRNSARKFQIPLARIYFATTLLLLVCLLYTCYGYFVHLHHFIHN